MKIVFGASRPNKFKIGAAGIMWWEETKASHLYTRIEIFPWLSIIFQAVGSGTEFVGLTYFELHNIRVYEKEIDIPQELYDKTIAAAIKKLKTKYSKKHLLGLFVKRAIQYITKRLTGTAKIISNPFKDKEKSEVCVEAMCQMVDAAEIVRKAEDPEDMGVYEALEMLYALPGKVLIGGENATI